MEKIKYFIESEKGKDIMIVLIVILVGLGSFELGRLSKANSSAGLKIRYGDQAGNTIWATESANLANLESNQNSDSSQKIFFASTRGSKYYTISCAAGKTIKQENRIYFTTGEEAEQAGYTLSSSCI